MNEAVPVAVELLDSAHHSLIYGRDMAPARSCQNIEYGVVVLIEQSHGSQSGVFAGFGFLADNVGRLHLGNVHGVEGCGELGRVGCFEQRHGYGVLCHAIRESIVHALGLVCDREGVENDLVTLKLRLAVGEGQGLGGFLCGFMNRRIEHVHDIDRAHISDGVVEVLSERRAEGECLPVVGVADEALDFAHVGYFYRHIDEIFVSVASDQVHRCGADIRGHHVGLSDGSHFTFADFAICAMQICHVLVLLIKIFRILAGSPESFRFPARS